MIHFGRIISERIVMYNVFVPALRMIVVPHAGQPKGHNFKVFATKRKNMEYICR